MKNLSVRFFRWRCLLYLQAAATKRTSKPIPPTHPREALKLKLRTRLRLRRTPLHRKQIPNPHPLKRQKQIRLQAEQQPSRQNSRLFLSASLPS